ncbi:hypothetical protein ABDI30_20205 [Paenibacillus cisolokensis]|uniref:hypothetical protein n=1 Tax=Paenibacillus cisolokensis TaxID=1658519 RepID=UPI003D2D5026
MNFEHQRRPQRASRMDVGAYALSKLAGAGALLMLLTAFFWLLPLGKNELLAALGVSGIPLEHIVYGYAMTATLVADAITSLLRIRSRASQAALYAACGLLFFGGFMAGSSPELWLRAATGALLLLGMRCGKELFSKPTLWVPFFALIVPLVCVVLY